MDFFCLHVVYTMTFVYRDSDDSGDYDDIIYLALLQDRFEPGCPSRVSNTDGFRS